MPMCFCSWHYEKLCRRGQVNTRSERLIMSSAAMESVVGVGRGQATFHASPGSTAEANTRDSASPFFSVDTCMSRGRRALRAHGRP